MAKRKIDDIAKIAAATFDTIAGQKFLAHLNEVFYNRPIYEGGLDTHQMIHNEGKRYMVHYINTLVKQGMDRKAAPTQAIIEEEESPDA